MLLALFKSHVYLVSTNTIIGAFSLKLGHSILSSMFLLTPEMGQPFGHNVAPVFITASDALLLWPLRHTFNWLTALQNASMARWNWLASHSVTMLHRYSSLQTMHYSSGSSGILSFGSRRGKRHRWQGGTCWPLANDQPLDHNVAQVFVTANDALLLWQFGHTFNWLTALQNGSMARRHWLASHSITMLHRYS